VIKSPRAADKGESEGKGERAGAPASPARVRDETMRNQRLAVRARDLSLLVGAIAALAFAARGALALEPAEPDAPLTADDGSLSGFLEAGDSDDAGVDASALAPALAPAPAPSVALTGGTNGSLVAVGEAWTTWRYGRSKGPSRASIGIDETTTRLRVSGSGRTFDGLIVGFSVGLLAPALRTGSYGSATRLAAVWARHDRSDLTPDIEWDTTVADGGPSTISLTVTSFGEVSHTSERRGGVTIDVTRFRIHGTLDATLPCTRSAATLRQSCRTESMHGTF
jgi:hypothetical protein